MGELVTARTAAERLGVDVRTLYAYVSRGALRRVPGPDGRSSRYDSDELELLARRSRPRTLPRPAASINLVIGTRVSTVTDGVVRYRGTDVLDLVQAEEPFERVADLLWQAAPPGSGDGSDGVWRLPAMGERPALPLAREIPVLHRFAIAVAAMTDFAAPGPTVRAAAASSATASSAATSAAAAYASTPDWPSRGRRTIGCLIEASASAIRDRDCGDEAGPSRGGSGSGGPRCAPPPPASALSTSRWFC